MAETASVCTFGFKAPPFRLPGTDGRTYSLEDVRGPNGTLIMFLCNHCPYVKAVLDRLVRDTRELSAHGIGCAAISSNDAITYPEDSFDNMKAVAAAYGFPFPYLYDESQEVARAYEAMCTPDLFGFNAGLELQYHGRVDASGREPAPPTARRELFDAMVEIAATGRGPVKQNPCIGCSIKWK